MPPETVRRPRIIIGTSGWSYPSWRHSFYAGVPQHRWLAFCAQHFTGIEVNATFYRRLKAEIIDRWRQDTPADFAFAVKGHRIVTHVHRLRDVEAALAEDKQRLRPLGDKLAAVVWQLPPSLPKDLGLLEAFAETLGLWRETRHVMEFRHPSWMDEQTLAVLRRYAITVCMSDAPCWPLWEAATSGLAYLRLHGHDRLYWSRYGEAALAPWAKKVMDYLDAGLDTHVYFDNDAEGAAPDDAQLLLRMVSGRQADTE